VSNSTAKFELDSERLAKHPMKIRLPIAIIASLFVIAFPLHAKDHNGIVDRLLRPLHAGTTIELKSTPMFLQRVFLPTLPEKENTLKIDDDAIDTIVDAPAGFQTEKRDGGVVTPRRSDGPDSAHRADGRVERTRD